MIWKAMRDHKVLTAGILLDVGLYALGYVLSEITLSNVEDSYLNVLAGFSLIGGLLITGVLVLAAGITLVLKGVRSA